MKTNVIPDRVELEVDIRTLPGETPDDVAGAPRRALGDLADQVEVEIDHERPGDDQPDGHAAVGRARHGPSPDPFPTSRLTRS